jgi:beta-galactosidase
MSMTQPGYGMDELFGAKETYAEFTPDLLQNLSLTVDGSRVWGGEYLQCYEPTTGKAVGWYDDGRIAAVTHTFGKGKTLLIGTMLGYGYAIHGGAEGNYKAPNRVSGSFFDAVLKFAGKSAQITVSDSQISARLHTGDGGTWLWICNPKRHPIPVRIEIPGSNYSKAEALLGPKSEWENKGMTLTVPARDVIMYELK